MDDALLTVYKKPEFKNPILVEGLPGIGLVGKLAGDHLLDELKWEKIAEIHSPYLPPQVNIQKDGTIKLVNMEFHACTMKGKEIILLTGDYQGLTPDSQYRLANTTIDFSKQIGVKRMYTLGGLATGNVTQKPKVFGAATSTKLVKEHKKYDIDFRKDGAIFGASGLLLGLSQMHNIEAVCLMGETHGQIVDAKAAKAILKRLTKILDVKVDMKAIDEKAKQTEKQINEISKMVNQYQKQKPEEFTGEPSTYIR